MIENSMDKSLFKVCVGYFAYGCAAHVTGRKSARCLAGRAEFGESGLGKLLGTVQIEECVAERVVIKRG